jgi:hypothetical protein
VRGPGTGAGDRPETWDRDWGQGTGTRARGHLFPASAAFQLPKPGPAARTAGDPAGLLARIPCPCDHKLSEICRNLSAQTFFSRSQISRLVAVNEGHACGTPEVPGKLRCFGGQVKRVLLPTSAFRFPGNVPDLMSPFPISLQTLPSAGDRHSPSLGQTLPLRVSSGALSVTGQGGKTQGPCPSPLPRPLHLCR